MMIQLAAEDGQSDDDHYNKSANYANDTMSKISDWPRSHHQRHGCGLPGQGDPDHYRAQVGSSTIVLEFLIVAKK